MKAKLVGILFISMYLTAMFRPISYFVEYFANYDYIKEELCKNKEKPYLECNGTCYVESLLKSSNLLEDGNSQKTVIPDASLFFPIFVLNEIDFSFSEAIFIEKSIIPNFSKQFIIDDFINDVFRPPKLV